MIIYTGNDVEYRVWKNEKEFKIIKLKNGDEFVNGTWCSYNSILTLDGWYVCSVGSIIAQMCFKNKGED